MCIGDIVTIGFEDECKVASAPTYIVHSDNLRIVSQNGYSAQVEALSNGVGYIQVNISNSVGPSQGFGRQIHVGTPNLDHAFVTEIDSGTFLSLYPPNNFCDLVALRIDGIERFDLVDEIEMQKLPTSIAYWDGDQRTGRDNTVGIYPNCNELFRFQVRARNACGWSEWVEFVKDIDGCSNDCSTTSLSNIVSNNFIISPVPASTIIAIDMIQDPQWTFYTKACSDGIADVGGTTHCTYFVSIQLYDFSGNQVLNISHHELGTSFDISHLTTGTYVMHVSHGGQTEIHQIPIN
ncbi:MAG: T9SS type A sorting domain-containing protein [Nonlabens sp.]|uniref:T9SS type A sorting domain-containing protein n=2 Tax=Nonlabens sp. TaxID=1888209 RepID=UPI00321A2E2E